MPSIKSTYTILLFLLFLSAAFAGCEGHVSAPVSEAGQAVADSLADDSLALAKRIFRDSPQEAYRRKRRNASGSKRARRFISHLRWRGSPCCCWQVTSGGLRG